MRPDHQSLQKLSNSDETNLTGEVGLEELNGLTGLSGLTGLTGLTGPTEETGTEAHRTNGPKIEDYLSDQETKKWVEDLYSQYIDPQS